MEMLKKGVQNGQLLSNYSAFDILEDTGNA